MHSEKFSYSKGFADGYRAGLADGLAGKNPLADIEEHPSLALAALPFSTKVKNCLLRSDCLTVGDVATLPKATLSRMRGLGEKTGHEIATTLRTRGIYHTAWDFYLED